MRGYTLLAQRTAGNGSGGQETGLVAIYRFEAKVISRGGGRSAVGAASYRSGKWATAARGGKCATSAAAYRAAAVLEDERTGLHYDYTRKRGVLGAEIMLPVGAPSWMADRAALWNAVEVIEKRKDAQLARDFVISLPHELNHEQRVALTRQFVREQFCARGYVADIAWHAPSKAEGLNWHAHVMVAMRRVEGTGFAAKKDRAPGDGFKHPALVWKEELMRQRIAWADTANKHLEAAGLDIRIDHRSLETRGIDREPEPKLGPLAKQMERAGRETFARTQQLQVQARNAERARLKSEHAEAVAEENRIVDMMTHGRKDDGTKPDAPSEEILRGRHQREVDLLREMHEQEARLAAFRHQKEREAEDAVRKRDEAAKEEARRQREGDVASATARYGIALGETYNVRDPYGSLANAAMREYGMFLRGQEKMRAEIAREQDSGKRREIELRKEIEAHDYMAITSQRLSGISAVLAGREDAPQAVLDRDRAAAYRDRARELREERSRLIEEREKQNRRDAVEPTRSAQRSASHEAEVRTSNDNRREDELRAKVSGRREGEAEITNAKQAKLDRLRATEASYGKYDVLKQQQRDRGGGGRSR